MIDFMMVLRIKGAIEDGLRAREGKILDDETIAERANNIAIMVAEVIEPAAGPVCGPEGCTPVDALTAEAERLGMYPTKGTK